MPIHEANTELLLVSLSAEQFVPPEEGLTQIPRAEESLIDHLNTLFKLHYLIRYCTSCSKQKVDISFFSHEVFQQGGKVEVTEWLLHYEVLLVRNRNRE